MSGMALDKNGQKYLLLANHKPEPIEFHLHNFKKGKILSRLNEKNVISFMNDPFAFFEKKKEEPVENTIRLMPYEVMVLISGS
jgi:hypothetical protein